MSDKPLHVQVAEALGCKARLITDGSWQCKCDFDSDIHMTLDDSPSAFHVMRYDTDWAATGPLIEKYEISIDKRGNGQWFASRRVSAVVERVGVDAWAPNPLEVVCQLILQLGKAGKL